MIARLAAEDEMVGEMLIRVRRAEAVFDRFFGAEVRVFIEDGVLLADRTPPPDAAALDGRVTEILVGEDSGDRRYGVLFADRTREDLTLAEVEQAIVAEAPDHLLRLTEADLAEPRHVDGRPPPAARRPDTFTPRIWPSL